MLEQTKRISLRISSVLSKVEPDLPTSSGSDQKGPTGSDSATLAVPEYFSDYSVTKIISEFFPRQEKSLFGL